MSSVSSMSQGSCCLCFTLALIYSSTTLAKTYDQCLLQQSRSADGNTTLKEIRAYCHDNAEEIKSPIENRVSLEKKNRGNRFTITPHRPNYILPISYNTTPNRAPYKEDFPEENLANTEIKFQFSLKAPLSYGVFNGYGDLWVAYTNTSWWQAYNDNSAPFRETNHEPEIFFTFPTDHSVLGANLDVVMLGFSHQSNGQSGSLSRSWNRLYANFVFTKDNFILSAKPWWRIPEPEKDTPTDPKGDDNPDIYNFMGYGELGLAYKFNNHTLGVMLRNNLRKDNKGAVQLDWSFPINNRFRGYFQYFNGYGESLIDYDSHTRRFSIGVMLTDWL
ncbi:phospholipase [Endozoicomonas sp. (ex Bugula neritina AB1)]|nr:phospholipase [Endozoicomonas sp. (ex Bugula neritina AB1)]